MSEDDDGHVVAFDEGDAIAEGLRAWVLLGVGPRCETWLTWSERLLVPAVCKIPRQDEPDHPSARQALLREAEFLRRVAHPAFPRLYEADLCASRPYVVTEFVEGETLGAVLDESGAFDDLETAQLGAQLAVALGHLHSLGVVHHDVKPGNVMLRDGRPVLIDFGFVERVGHPPLPGGPRGTDGYMAPEHEACGVNTPASDFYSLGVLLHEVRTGVVVDDLVLPARAEVDPADALGRAIVELLEPDHTRRPSSATAVLELLAPALAPDGAAPWPAWAFAAPASAA